MNCLRGAAFIESIDAKSFLKNAVKMFELFYKYSKIIGSHSVIHVITDNTSDNVLAGLLQSKPMLFHTKNEFLTFNIFNGITRKFFMDKYPHKF